MFVVSKKRKLLIAGMPLKGESEFNNFHDREGKACPQKIISVENP
jgi:hypothetical protein